MTNKEIATYLRAQATQYPEQERLPMTAGLSETTVKQGNLIQVVHPARYEGDLAVFNIDGMKILCKPSRQAIEQVADKFDKGPHSSCKPRQVKVGQCKEPTIRKMSAKQLYMFGNEALLDGHTIDREYYGIDNPANH